MGETVFILTAKRNRIDTDAKCDIVTEKSRRNGYSNDIKRNRRYST